MGDGVLNLGEPLDEGSQGLPWALLDGMEVNLIAGPSVRALKVGRELMSQLFPGVQGPWGQVHKPRSGHASQSHREVVGYDGLNPLCGKDGGRVDVQDLGGIDGPVVFF
jgi:hypothetical protein